MRPVALLLFVIHLAFADFFSITCEDETGSVGDEFTLTCTFSDQEHVCCKKNNKFRQIASNDSSTICKGEFSTDPCVKMNNFSCFYTLNSAMTTKLEIFLQTECESIITDFTDDYLDNNYALEDNELAFTVRHGEFFELIVAAGCVLVLIVFAAIIGVIVWMKSSQVKRLLKGYMLGSNADSMSDQEMQKYPSSHSMEYNPPSL